MKNEKQRELSTIDSKTGKRIIHIVYTQKDKEYAVYAKNLISCKQDIKGQIIDDKTFYASKVSSDNIIIYIGNIKNTIITRKAAENTIRYNYHGMRYAWKGTEAFVWIEPCKLSQSSKKNIIRECEKIAQNITKEKKYSLKEFGKDSIILFLFGMIGVGSKYIIQILERQKDLRKCRKILVITKFVNEKIDAFINQAIKGA